MTEQTERKTRVITLTDRPRVRIVDADWPLIADAERSEHDGEIESQANRVTRRRIRVRRHQDGRTIVYGWRSYSTAWQDERGTDYAGGVLLGGPDEDPPTAPDIIAAINGVADQLAERSDDREMIEVGRECIADLPPEDL